MDSDNKRDRAIDIVRGVGIILMVMGHVGFGTGFDKWVHGFHMPLFFIISGCFIKIDEESSTFWRKKIKKLILPYFAFAFFFELIAFVLFDLPQNGLVNMAKDIILRPTTGLGPIVAGGLWFFPALFWGNVGFYCIDKVVKHVDWVLFALCILICVLGMIIVCHFGIRFPMGLDAGFVGIGFVGIGHFIKKIGFVEKIPISLAVCGGIIGSALVFANEPVNYRTGEYGIYALTIFNAIILFVAIWKIASVFVQHNIKTNYLEFVGRNSIIFVCFNQIFLRIINPCREKFLIGNAVWDTFIEICITVLVMFLCHVAVYGINETKLKIMIGQ